MQKRRLGKSNLEVSALALLLIGIHNAWDTVTHLVVPESRDATKGD
jgi:aryl-alcohol dehydrogenase-like predicted oxidoreductase